MARPARATAYAPASIGNVAVGFDMLGLAIEGAGDRVSARRTERPGVHLLEVRDPAGNPHAGLPSVAAENTAGVAALALWAAHGDDGGIELVVEKGIALASGMGSSAASAVAGAAAANALLDAPLPAGKLLPFALEGEKLASGGIHADNVAPSLLGGLVFCPPALLPEVWSLDLPEGLCSVLVHPDLEVATSESRCGLATSCSMEQWLTQQGYLGAFFLALQRHDVELIGRSLRDVVIEPQRAGRIAGFAEIRAAAMEAGALGASLSGSGPSLFALAASADGNAVRDAMVAACRDAGHACDAWISPLASPGVQVEVQT